MYVFRSLFVLFLLAIVLSVFRFTYSDYLFGKFKLLFHVMIGLSYEIIFWLFHSTNWSWIIVGNMFEWVTCLKSALHTKDLFSIFQKRVGALESLQKMKFVVPTQHSMLFSVAVVDPSLPTFYIVCIYYWTCSRPEYSWNTVRWPLSNNQSIYIYLGIPINSYILLFYLR